MIPFVGPSYNLNSRPSGVQRTINMVPVKNEPGNDVHQWVFRDLPGLTQFASLGAEIRGGIDANGRVFVLAGNTLYEVSSGGVGTSRGTISSSSGLCELTYNTTQLVFADTAYLYVFTFATNVLTSTALDNVGRVAFLDQYILYVMTDTQQFGWTALGDATSIDALDFSSAEGSPDNLVTLLVDHRELVLFGRNSVEIWTNTGSAYVFERNSGAFIEDGCASVYAPQKVGGSVYWTTQSDKGQGSVMSLTGYQPQKISTKAIEERLTGVDLTGATSYTYTMDGSAFYCLNVPGVDTTLVYDASTQQWHERAELVDGEYTQHRARCHLFAFNKNLVGDTSGYLYQLDPEAYDNDGDELCRERITPNSETPDRARVAYGTFHLSCDRGFAGQAMLRQSNDGGRTWSSWRIIVIGELGDYTSRVKWERCGSAVDRVWQVRCTDAVPFNPTGAEVK